MIHDWQHEFLDFLIEQGALRFGSFVTKSGRQSPYFMNTGSFHGGASIDRLGEAYARAIADKFPDATCIFGPAYKGIPLAVAAASAWARLFKKDIGWCFNRKEAKDHGDAGLMVGKPLASEDRVVIVDDVVTAGISVRESFEILAAQGKPRVLGICVSVNRQETDKEGRDAVGAIEKEYGVPVEALLTIEEIVQSLRSRNRIDAELEKRIADYRAAYGVKR